MSEWFANDVQRTMGVATADKETVTKEDIREYAQGWGAAVIDIKLRQPNGSGVPDDASGMFLNGYDDRWEGRPRKYY